jgi:hypothetical protein
MEETLRTSKSSRKSMYLAPRINPQGDIVGFYIDGSGDTHGFLLSEGRFTSIDVPGAFGISRRGSIVGTYFDGRATRTVFC